jgi:hypothetical protein
MPQKLLIVRDHPKLMLSHLRSGAQMDKAIVSLVNCPSEESEHLGNVYTEYGKEAGVIERCTLVRAVRKRTAGEAEK